MKEVFYVLARNNTEATWLTIGEYDFYFEAENFLKEQALYMQYKIEKVWSYPF